MTPRILSDNAWPIGITLVGMGISWGIMTATVHGKADAQDVTAITVRVTAQERTVLTKAEFEVFVVRDSAWKANQADLSLDTYCAVNSRAKRCNP